MDDQLTFRIPRALARALAREARGRGVPRSLVVREALSRYLAETVDLEAARAPDGTGHGASVRSGPRQVPTDPWARVRRFVGAVVLDDAAVEADALARRIRTHNWRAER